jgi:chemotaxis protein CheX
MHTSTVDLGQIASDIWAAMLGLELTASTVTSYPRNSLVVTGSVSITGDWTGAVTVQCSDALSQRATALMFGLEPDEVTEEEISDTVGELANMAGGNVKALLGGSSQLSLPSVTTGRDYHVAIPGAEPVDRLAMDCDGELVVLTLLERRSS